MKKINIYINDCIRWSGGLNILIQLISALNNSNNISFEILYVKPSFLTKILNFFRLLLRGGSYKVNKLIDEDLFKKFQEFIIQNDLEIKEFNYREFKRKNITEYLFPVMKLNSSLKSKKLIGYIPDCQHLHLKDLFLKRVIWYRNYQFSRVKKYCEKVISTSDSVKKDLLKHYSFSEKQIITLGFNPIRFENKNNFNRQLEEDYFLIANQLWEHKNHEFAIKAFKKYLERNKDSKTKLLCTGYLHDHRNSSHSRRLLNLIQDLDLNDSVLFLGYLQRDEFLDYLVYAKAVVQPSVFEGTPGGLSSADAASYGVDVFVSNIEVNKEIIYEKTSFFDTKNIDSLVDLFESEIDIDLNNRLSESLDSSNNSKERYSQIIYENINDYSESQTQAEIVIDITSFTKWSGGTRLLYQFLDLLYEKNSTNLSVLDRSSKNILFFILNLIKYRKNYKLQIAQETKLKNTLFSKINKYYPNINIKKPKDLTNKFIILPLLDFRFKFRKNGLFFIPDIGHHELKENFNAIIRFRRYIQIRLILTFSKYVLVNSNYIKQSIENLYKSIKSKIVVAPFYGFVPVFEKDYISKDFKNVYTKSQYFIVCNQFWIHKNHLTAIKAIKLLNERNGTDIKIICTGFKIDYRGNDHVEQITNYIKENQIENQVIFTDYLEREELLNLINNSIALIQPSLYEGGPGGFSSADAVSLNKKVIISNIEINNEINNDKRFTFFESNNEDDLSIKLENCIQNNKNENLNYEYRDDYMNFLKKLLLKIDNYK